jgi:hypothetical protein
MTVNNGGRLVAADSTFALTQLVLNTGALVNAGDLSNNAFDLPIFVPASAVPLLSASGGGSDNVRFQDINILAGTLVSGSLNLDAIGTGTTANLRYVFPGGFTIASDATVNVAPNVRISLSSNQALTVNGAANFATGSTVTLDGPGFNLATQASSTGRLTPRGRRSAAPELTSPG